MNEIVQIAHNAVSVKLVNASREVKLQVQSILSYKVEGAEHMSAFQSGGWDGRSSFLTFTDGSFPRGFVALVVHRLNKLGYKTQIVKNPYPAPLGDEFPIVDKFGEDPRYDYQREVYEKLLSHGQIIAQVATGGGKSRIAKLAVSRINRPTLFLTTRGVLMYQMADGFQSLGKKVAILGDGNIEVSNEITCGMVQTIISWIQRTTYEGELDKIVTAITKKEEKEVSKLTANLKKKKIPLLKIAGEVKKLNAQFEKERPSTEEVQAQAKQAFTKQMARSAAMKKALEKFEFVILEEAHEASGNSYYDILRNCPNAHYRLALTATPFMKDSEEANMRLMASSGHVAIKISEQTLIERGILAKPYFKYIPMLHVAERLYKSTPWQAAYEFGIVKNEKRNKHIVFECLRAKKYGLPGMILVLHTEHGKILHEMLAKYGVRSEYIFGEDNQDERKSALNRLRDGDIDVLIGSTILDVGVDVPAVGLIVLAGAGKAEVAVRQRIGRGLRAKKNGPNAAFIVDFADDHNNHLKSHYLARRQIVMGTPGFAENIVADFDYEAIGFTKTTL